MEKRYQLVNWTFLITVLFYLGASMLLAGWLTQQDNLLLRLGVSQLILVLPTLCYLILTKEPLAKTIRLRPLGFGRILLLVVFAILIMPFMSFVNSISLLFTTNRVAVELQSLADLPLAVSLLFVGVLPAVLEESVYRGVFYNEYRKVSLPGGILLSGFLFGLMHLNLNQFSYAFVMGCIFAVVIEVTDSIVSTMVIHFMINGFSTVTTYLLPKLQKLLEAEPGISGTLAEQAENLAVTPADVLRFGMAAVVPTGLAVLVLVLIARMQGRSGIWRELVRSKGKERLMTAPLLAGILICVGYIILYEVTK